MKILISQSAPSNMAPYEPVQKKYSAKIDFRPFFLIEPLSSREFRAQRINFSEYTAIVFSSRHAIDAYFKLAEELRFKVPETLKYFCTTELVAMYLQKHIVYRKRKIFFGDGKPESIISLIGSKHKGEKFLITASEGSNTEALTSKFDSAGLEYTTGIFVKSVPQNLHDLRIDDYDVVILYNQFDMKSLLENFPDFRQKPQTKFIAFGKNVSKAMTDAGLEVAAQGPTPEAPSAARTLELYLASR